MKIITHSGTAHRDDFLAVCLLLAKYPDAVVERRPSVSAGDVGEGDVVVDIGRRYEPGRWYDHHQDMRLPCSLILVLRDEFSITELPKEILWIDTADRYGPSAAYRVHGMVGGGGLVERLILTAFSEKTSIDKSQPLYHVMSVVGSALLRYLEKWRALRSVQIVELPPYPQEGVWRANSVNLYRQGPYVVAFTDIADFRVSDLVELVSAYGELVGIITPNNREPRKTSVISVDNNPRFIPESITSFSISFLHPSRFMAVLDAPYEEVLKNYHRVALEALQTAVP